jgi:pyruvate/2-oxoglutarate dehydrogenase complex dihydrolipoamide dehydrogenase (E3) component/uncharacterized membrane protein YdjX (TVP38/TMEM64 family)
MSKGSSLSEIANNSNGSKAGPFRRAIPILVLIAGLVAYFAFGLDEYITLESLKDNRVALQEWVDAYGFSAGLAYMAVYAVAIALSIPGGLVLTVAGGFLFGPYWATLYVVIGATVGATIVFLAARYALADFLRRKAGTAMAKMEAGFNEQPLSYLLLLRLIPLFPFWLVNIVPAFLGVSLPIYVIATFLGIIPATFVFALVGDGIGAVLDKGQDLDPGIIFEPRFLWPIVGLIVLVLIPVIYKKIKRPPRMTNRLTPDLCVIGAGSGGLTIAAGASQMGADVVLLEKGKMGGDCLNYGCVPSKALIAASHAAEAIRRAPEFGIDAGDPAVDFARVHGHVHSVIDAIAPNDSVERFEGLGVTVINQAGRFSGPRTVQAGETEIMARRIVVATGSSAAVPPIPGLETVPFMTNETVFDRTEAPQHLIVIGGGPIGVELAQAFRRLGARVTILEMFSVLGRDDPELAEFVKLQLRKDGVEIREGIEIQSVESRPGGVAVRIKDGDSDEEVSGSDLLVAAGRRANLDGLDLDAAGIKHSAKGIEVDAGLRTSNRRVYAIGDAAGPYQFTHMASYQASVVLRSALFRLPAKVDYRAVPWVTYTSPELAHVGMSEKQAADAHGAIRVLRFPFAENDRAQAERETDGLVKVITNKRGVVVGAGIVGAHAGELIQSWIVPISRRMHVKHVAGGIVPYPTLGEINKRAAGSYFTPALFGDRTKKLVRFLAKFG